MNILKTAVIAVLLGTMTIEEVQAVSLNKMHHKKHSHKKHHAKHHKHSLAQKEEEVDATGEEKKEASETQKKVEGEATLETKDDKAQLADLKAKKDALEGKTIEPRTEEQEAEDTKATINKLANEADANNNTKAHAAAA